MAARLISYDLKRPGQNYDDLHEAIKALGGWWHCLESTWIVTTSLTASQVRDRLQPHLDRNDEVLVLDVTGDDWATRGLSDQCNDWLRNNV